MYVKLNIMTLEKAKAIYLSLREQYLSDRPMTKGEEETMWSAWYRLTDLGWGWARIKDEQLRENRNE